MMNFEEVLFRAKMGDHVATERILEMFRPLLIKNSLINGKRKIASTCSKSSDMR